MLKKVCTYAQYMAPWMIASILWIVKTGVFYSQFGLAGQEPAIIIAGTAILLLLSSAAGFFSHRAGKWLFISLYVCGCLLMAVDSVYFSYTHKLPSIAQITTVNQLYDVRESIVNLMEWKQILPLVDFPLWFLWSVNRKKSNEYSLGFYKKFAVGGLTAALVCTITVICYGVFGSFRAEYMVNELFCYHTKDIWNTFFVRESDRTVDKSLYILEDDSDSPWYGIAAGRNVVILQIEALQNFVIGSEYNGIELTPNLNALIKENSLYFDRYYYQIGGGNTSDAEFAVNNSLFAPHNQATYIKYTDNDYFGLPFLLKENGYSGAHAFHNYEKEFWNRNTAYTYQGFDSYTALEDFEYLEPFDLGISDKELFRQSMEKLKTYTEPFYAFYVTVSSHHPYSIPEEYRSLSLKPEDEETLFGNYMQAVHYVDYAIGYFLDLMKEAGLYENTIFVLYGDHYALHNTDEQVANQVISVTGKEQYTIFDVFNVPCIIHIPGSGITETISVAGGHMDVLPTLLCLLGINEVHTVMFGQNLLTAETGIVCQQTHLSIGSFINDEVFFTKPHNNILANYSVYEFGTMNRADPLQYAQISKYAEKCIDDCSILMDKNDLFVD